MGGRTQEFDVDEEVPHYYCDSEGGPSSKILIFWPNLNNSTLNFVHTALPLLEAIFTIGPAILT
jgi:hypothetical protein